MIKKKINISIIGAGFMASEYLNIILDMPQFNIVGIYSRSSEKCIALQNKFKSLIVFNNIEEMYKLSDTELVIIACSAESTKSIAEQVTRYPWTILFEKPLGLNFSEYEEITKWCFDRNSKAYIALNRRYFSSTINLVSMLNEINGPRHINIYDQENIEELVKANRDQRLITNWMYANSIHLIDYIDILSRGNLVELKILDKWNSANPDIVSAILKFDTGDIINYKAVWNGPAPWEIKVFTKEKYFNLKPIEKLSYISKHSRVLNEVEVDEIDIKYKPGLYNLLKEMYKCMNNLPHKIPTVVENKATMSYIKSIYEL